MDLTQIVPLDFRGQLSETENEAISPVKWRNSDLVRVTTGLLAGGAAGLLVFLATVLAAFFSSSNSWAGLSVMLGSLLTIVAAIVASKRYLAPPERRLLSLRLEPDAKAFLHDNWARRERLLAEASTFNAALQAFKALPARTGVDEVNVAVAENLAERRMNSEAEIAGYLDDFKRATEDDRARVVAIKKARSTRPTPEHPDERRLTEFKQRVSQLLDLENALDGFDGSIGERITVNLSPFIAAQRLRGELEEERQALVACGLKPKKLPAPRIDKKFLPAPA